MPTFRQRPLSWLFFIATACLAIAAGVRDDNSPTMDVVLTGQVYVIAGWVAVGRMHRLARGALLFVIPVATAISIRLLGGSPAESRAVLAATLLLSAVVFVSTACCAAVIRAVSGPAAAPETKWQISLIEIMGWTVVVAIASAAARNAELPPLEHIHALWGTLASGVVAGAAIALFLHAGAKHDRVALVIAATVLGAFFAVANLTGEFGHGDSTLTVCLFAYVALWILVMRLDEHANAMRQPLRAATSEPGLKLHSDFLENE